MAAYLPVFLDDDVDGRPKQWLPAEGEDMPAEFEDALLDDRVTKLAWNKPFEWNITTHSLGIETPHRSWKDPMVVCLALSLPGKLEKACEVLRLGDEFSKRKSGTTLINWFCKMRAATKTQPIRRVLWHEKPEKWEEFKTYNIFDVIAEHEIWERVRRFDLSEFEWENWEIDQEINNEGLPVNVETVENAIRIRDYIVDLRMQRMREITGLVNPNSNDQLLPWLQDEGYPFDDLKAGHVRRAVERYDEETAAGRLPNQSEDYREVLGLRLEVSKSSTKKYDAILSHVDSDGRLRNTLQFAGAGRTWRYAGRVYQPQNLFKPLKGLDGLEWEVTEYRNGGVTGRIKTVSGGFQIRAIEDIREFDPEIFEMVYPRPMDVLAGGVRPVVEAPDGYVFIDLDWNAIENRILGWMTGDRKILRVFENDLDPYLDFASKLFGIPYAVLKAEYDEGNGAKRTVGKPGVLGCGYMLGAGKEFENKKTGEIEATGLLGYAWNMGVRNFTHQQSELSVSVWREEFRTAVKFWYDLMRAAMECVRTGRETWCRDIGFDRKGMFLRMILPSGRCLYYVRPKIMDWKMPWGDMRPALTYEQKNDRGAWARISTHPGKVTENADQAIARDVLARGLRKARRNGIPVCLHVHDQIVGLVKESEAEDKLLVLKECMEEEIGWAPGLPLKAAGHISKWFVKD